jgi:hypothetical protein
MVGEPSSGLEGQGPRVRRCLAFFNIATSNRPLYMNPVLIQALAGAAKEGLADAQVEVFDGAAGDSWTHRLAGLDSRDIAIVCLMHDENLDEFASAAPVSLKMNVPIVLVGDLVTDGEPRFVLSRMTSVLPNNPTHIFMGRESERFIEMLRAIVSHSPVEELPNVLSFPNAGMKPDWDALPSVTQTPRLLFTDTIIRAIKERGVTVLMEGLTRGCEHHCTYCHLNFNKQTRGLVQRIPGDTAERISDVAHCIPENSFVFFTDENFFGGKNLASKDRLESIVRLSEDLIESGLARRLAVDTRIDSLWRPDDDEGMRLLRRRAWQSFRSAGLTYTYLGVESFSESQLRRYAKSPEYPALRPGIALARELGLAFTLGMIIMDPFVTPQEIEETLAFVDRLDLYPHIASPLKPLRLGVKSPYAGWASKRLPTSDLTAFPSGVDTFRNARIREVWPLVRSVHRIFSAAGYRHSDAAMFDAVFWLSSPRVSGIPEKVSRMECEILHTLVDGGATDAALGFTTRLVEDTVHNCKDWIAKNCVATPGSIQDKVGRYFRAVFDVIQAEVALPDWLERSFDGT